MDITFILNNEEEPRIGKLEYYYNGMFYVRDNDGRLYQITESNLTKEPNEISNTFYVRTGGRTSLYTNSKFELTEAFADGYNEAVRDQDNWSEEDLAKVYFGEY